MEVTWLGHSCFKIRGKEITLVTDPFGDSVGYPQFKPTANIVTISHAHTGHSYAEGVDGSPKVIKRPGEYEIGGVFITGISTFHDLDEGETRGKNTIYLIEMEDVRLCHLGDLGHIPSPQQIEDLGNVEVLFLPIGGISTIDAKMAAEIVRLLNPKVIYPMHYGTEAASWLEPSSRFLKEMGLGDVVPQPRHFITRSNLPSETQVVLLDYRII